MPGLRLTTRERVQLIQAYSFAPGRLIKYRKTIAQENGDCAHGDDVECECAKTVERAHKGLRDKGLLDWAIIKAKHALPWKNAEGYASRLHNQICRVFVTRAQAAKLAELLKMPLVRVVGAAAGLAPTNKKDPSTGTKKNPSTRSRSSLLRREDPNHLRAEDAEAPELGATPGVGSADSPPRRCAPRPPSGGREDVKQDSANDVPPEAARVLALWEETGLAPVGRNRGPTILANRHAELVRWDKLSPAEAWARLEDVARDGWRSNERFLRHTAKVPFAAAFATLATVNQYAHEGRKVREARELDESQRAAAAAARKVKRAAALAEEQAAERQHKAYLAMLERGELGPLPPPAAPPARPPMTPDEALRERARQLEAARALFDGDDDDGAAE